MTPEHLRRLYDTAQLEVFRLETHDRYEVAGYADRIRAFEAGRPLPTASAKTRWLEQVRAMTERGVWVHRVHVVDLPITPYLRYEIEAAYPENVRAGEGVRITDRTSHPDIASLRRDFVLFDLHGDQPVVVWFDYDMHGRLVSYQGAGDLGTIGQCAQARELALAHSMGLDAFTEQVV